MCILLIFIKTCARARVSARARVCVCVCVCVPPPSVSDAKHALPYLRKK